MDRDIFLNRLLGASKYCRDFTIDLVSDSLPAGCNFWVLLNCSYDGNALKDGEVVFPNDVQAHGERVGPLRADEVVSLLWRDGMIPEWIDISVYDADEQTTYFKLGCCGRFTRQVRLLYYPSSDVSPFGIKSPSLPKRLSGMMVDGKPAPKFALAESRQDWGLSY
jgi:hypothetical protein